MKKSVPYILCLFLLIACKKNTPTPQQVPTDPGPTAVTPAPNVPVTTPPTGDATITGTISPLDLAKTTILKLKRWDTNDTYTTTIAADGTFSFAKLPAGTYHLSLWAAPGKPEIIIYGLLAPPAMTRDIQTITLLNNGANFTRNGNSSITGKIQPANGAGHITARHKTYNFQYTATADANGNFTIKDLPEGDYTVFAAETARYTLADTKAQEVSLKPGQTADAGTFLFYDDTDPQSPNYLSYDLDGVRHYRDSRLSALYNVPNFTLSSWNTVSVYTMAIDTRTSVTADRLDITLDHITGPGTYTLKGTAKSNIKITHRDIVNRSLNGPVAGPLYIWSTAASGGSGTLTITSVDAANQTISGTFSATAAAESGSATGQRVITNGAFANFKYTLTP